MKSIVIDESKLSKEDLQRLKDAATSPILPETEEEPDVLMIDREEYVRLIRTEAEFNLMILILNRLEPDKYYSQKDILNELYSPKNFCKCHCKKEETE